ncbi:hypothetical protein L1987_56107 [Smallanthus sonchifolius]|uniref:Uncharacterized protein n=1 Tax=Smallanthus sonchifolius TaxID=185202 RepID=A0ACB9ECG3_9ASTR|nr:hypothetical protein L1987_56107 [Smallanthus sonchifolius]
MNFMGKSGGSGEEKEEKEEINKQPPLLDPWLSSSSSSSHHNHLHHHHRHHHHQQQPFFSPPSYSQPHGWLLDGGEPSSMVEREHMFDKVVTPSDVGKLNRLVIPKQHVERFFPLDSSTNYKGLQLNFEDRNGKLWRFQYSYWNSSQSYVMTKGWSRFVKEKKLDAGDVVSFQRGVGATAKDRLFIDWRRRVITNPSPQLPSSSDLSNYVFNNHNFIHPWNNPLVLQSLPARRNPNFMLQGPHINPNCSSSRSVSFRTPQQQFKVTQSSELGLGFGFDPPPPAASSSNPPALGKASGKRLRLFGVNMDCVFEEEASSSSFSTIPYLQLTPILSASSTHDFNIIEKSTVSSMSLDLKMSHTEAEI